MNINHLSFDLLIEIFRWVAQPKTTDHWPGSLAQSRKNMILWPPRRYISKESTSSPRYLYNCALVCQTWKEPALYVLYYSIIIKMHKSGGYKLSSRLRKEPNYASYVQHARLLSDTLTAKGLLYLGLYSHRLKELQINHLQPLQPVDYSALLARSPFRLLNTLLCITSFDGSITLETLSSTLLLMPSLENLGFSSLPPLSAVITLSPPPFRLKAYYSPYAPGLYTDFYTWLLGNSRTSLKTVAVDPMASSIEALVPILQHTGSNIASLQLPLQLFSSIMHILSSNGTRRPLQLINVRDLSIIHSQMFTVHDLCRIESPIQRLTILPHPFNHRRDFAAMTVCAGLEDAAFLKSLEVVRIQRYRDIPSWKQINYIHNWCTSRKINLEVFEELDDLGV